MQHGQFTPFDQQMMSRAIGLARKGRYTTAPNPNVGCIIALEHQILGEGFHLRAGEGHAEVNALSMAKTAYGSVAGATCYVTLEPCSHYGRTPPCAKALIDAKVARVVIAMVDPNPSVAGRGIQMLQDAGIQVEVGLLQQDAEALNPGFILRMTTKRPRVTLKMAASLDGKTALANGKSQWITSAAARQDVQRFRASSCFILTGADTVLADDPSLNVRWSELGTVKSDYPETALRQPVRVIVDSQNRVTPNCKLFSLPGKVILARHTITGGFGANVTELSIALQKNTHGPAKLDLSALLDALARLECNELWVEAGATLAGAFIEAQLVDRLICYIAPKIIGADAKPLIGINELTEMSQVLNWQWQDMRKVGADLRLTLVPA